LGDLALKILPDYQDQAPALVGQNLQPHAAGGDLILRWNPIQESIIVIAARLDSAKQIRRKDSIQCYLCFPQRSRELHNVIEEILFERL
jgi:hypothetical protein